MQISLIHALTALEKWKSTKYTENLSVSKYVNMPTTLKQ